MSDLRSGSDSTEREEFFNSLPTEEFTPLETALRQVLLDWLNSKPAPFTFPLIEWIDRRLGGEVATGKDENGQGEIRLHGSAGRDANASHLEAFFATLPEDTFTPEEEALREAIFDFLASWKSNDLANLANLCEGEHVQQKYRALLPPEVPLEDWLQHRVGGEIELREDPKTGQKAIHLTPSARPIVTQKFRAMQALEAAGGGAASAAGSAKGAQRGGAAAAAAATAPGADSQARRTPPPGKGAKVTGGKASGKKVVDKEEWFANLPSDRLSTEEATLRQALLDWLKDWPRRRPGNKSPSAPIYFQDAGQDAEVQKRRSALLPSNIQMREWIDRRIGGEVELHKDEQGQTEISIRGSKTPVASAGKGSSSAGGRRAVDSRQDDADGQEKASKSPSTGGKGGGAPGVAAQEEFFKRLPVSELTREELVLRLAVLDLVESRERAEGGCPLLSEACKDPTVAQARTALMPADVPLRQWLERRVGGELEVVRDEKGMFAIRRRDTSGSGGAQSREDSREKFFASLPEDRFTSEEERLREALLAYLDAWKGKEPPTLAHAGGDQEVRRCRSMVLPKGIQVSMKEWIDCRMGGEIEMAPDAAGQVVFARRGNSLTSGHASSDTSAGEHGGRKRQRERERESSGKGGGGKAATAASAGQAPWKKARNDDEDKGGRGGGSGNSRHLPLPRR